MGMLTIAPITTGGRPATANQLWKARWSIWMVRSTLAAAVTHAVVLTVWPMWEIRGRDAVDPPIELIQITPIAAAGGMSELSEGMVALPSLDEVDLALEEARAGVDEEVEETADYFGVEEAAGAPYPLIPDIVSSNTIEVLETAQLILERLTVITPELASLAPDLAWPQIRNPTIMRRFLRTQYNPLHAGAGATGMVSVAIWIDERGTVEFAQVSESSGFTQLDEIAVALFQNVVNFAPARSGRAAVPVQVTVSVPFMLPW